MVKQMPQKPKEYKKSIYFLDRVSHVREIFVFGGNPFEDHDYIIPIGRVAAVDGEAKEIVCNFIETNYAPALLKKGDSLSYGINEISIIKDEKQRKIFTME